MILGVALGGCASMMNPPVAEDGSKLVYVKEVRVLGRAGPDAGVSGALGGQVGGAMSGTTGAVVGGGVEAAATAVINAARGVRILVNFMDFDPRVAGAPKFFAGRAATIERAPWPGSEQLRAGGWAVLTTDEEGDRIVVPCKSECKPQK